MVAALFEQYYTTALLNVIALVVLSAMFWAAILSYRLGNKVALYYMIAQLVYLAASFLFLLLLAGVLPHNNFTRYGILVGTVYEALFFSFALAYRIKVLKDKNLLIVQKAKKELEEKVKERTWELKELNRTLESRVEEEVKKNTKHQHLIMRKSRLAEMGEMINSIAHQWRQPLNRINSNVAVIGSVLRREQIDHGMMKSQMEKIKLNTKYMSDTIEDFSNFLHPEKKESQFVLQEITNKALKLIDVRTKNIEISILSDKDLEVLSFEKEYLQVILIILNNAIDSFESNATQDPRIEIVIKESDDGMVYLSICDNGRGIEKKSIVYLIPTIQQSSQKKEPVLDSMWQECL